MQITLRQMQALDSADLDFAGIALVAGLNSEGKTTLARYVGTALSGGTMPADLGLAKKDAGVLVRHNLEHGGVAVHTGSGHVALTYPQCERRSEGAAPHASLIAVGQQRLTQLPVNERASVLGKYIKADPAWRDFVDALKAAGITDPTPPLEEAGQPVPGVVERTWKAIEVQGWDGAHRQWTEHAAQKKGAWQQVTGESWGGKKAATWLPAGWEMDLGELARETLEANTTAAGGLVDAALVAKGADAERDRADADKVASREAVSKRLKESQTKLAKAEADLEIARQTRASLPEAEAGDLTCPHCSEPVRMDLVAGTLVKASGKALSAAELKKARENIAKADGTLSRHRSEVTQLSGEVQRLEAALEEIEALAGAPIGSDDTTADANIAHARNVLEHAMARLARFDAKATAARVHAQIQRALAIVGVLAPDGLRKTCLARALDVFNDGPLAELCEAASYAAVTFNPDLSISYGRYPYALCSTANQYRVDAVLKAACARLDGSALVICDGADVLDEAGREGLIGLLLAAEVPALVCMTYDRPAKVPDLKAAGIGESYWLADGRSRPLAEAAAEVA